MGAALGTLWAAAVSAVSYALITAAEYTAAYAAVAGAYITNSAVAAGLITQSTVYAYELGSIGITAVISTTVTTTITPLGAVVFGAVGATTILGIGGGIINASLGSGHSQLVPTQPSYDNLIKGVFCGLLDYVNGCRMLSGDGDQRTVRVQAGQKRSRPVQSTSEEVLLSR